MARAAENEPIPVWKKEPFSIENGVIISKRDPLSLYLTGGEKTISVSVRKNSDPFFNPSRITQTPGAVLVISDNAHTGILGRVVLEGPLIKEDEADKLVRAENISFVFADLYENVQLEDYDFLIQAYESRFNKQKKFAKTIVRVPLCSPHTINAKGIQSSIKDLQEKLDEAAITLSVELTPTKPLQPVR